MDDGPKPLKNLKPAKQDINATVSLPVTTAGVTRSKRKAIKEKKLNSADQFWQDHQAGYEDMGKDSVNWTDRVENHNSAYPKMKDEIDRRRSINQVKALKANRNCKNESKCKACLKLKQLGQLQKLNIRPKCKSSPVKRKYNREIKSRVKKRARNNRMKRSLRRHLLKRRVQVKDKCTGMEDKCNLNERFIEKEVTIKSQSNSRNSRGDSVTNSVRTLKSPDTSNLSVTSYNTLASMDQEPMVSMD